MRSTIQRLIQRIDACVELPPPIYEFGSYQIAGHEGRSISGLFAGRDYVGADMRTGPAVDRILELQALDLPDESIGTAIALDTVEHVREVWKAAGELHRVLKPGGFLLLSSVMYFPIHAYPSDYWRFTPEGMRALIEPFETRFVESAGLRDFPHTVVAVGVKGEIEPSVHQQLSGALAAWKRRDAQGWREVLTMILPPALLAPLYRAFTRLTSPGDAP